MPIDPDDPRPQYRQIVEEFQARIWSGELAPGDRLPSTSQIEAGYGVSAGTARKAVETLSEAGFVVARQGKGVFVRSSPPAPQPSVAELAARVADLEEQMGRLTRRMDDLQG